jgi:hypothetical protein
MFLGTKVIQTVFVEILMFGEGEFVGNKSLLLARPFPSPHHVFS